MSEPTAFETQLRQGLVEAIAARRAKAPRPARRLVLAAAAVVVVAAVLLVVPNWSGGPSPALAVTRQDGQVVIDLRDPQASVSAMRQDLAAAGINAEVRRIPVSPSLAGSWLGAVLPNGVAAHDAEHRPVPHQPGNNRIVLRFDPGSRVTLFLGEVAGDRRNLVSVSAFNPGEPLHCSGIGGQDTTRAAEALAARGLTVRWFPLPPAGKPASVVEPTTTAPRGTVIGAEMESATTVRVTVLAPGETPPPDVGSEIELQLADVVTGADPQLHNQVDLGTTGSQC